MPVEIASLAIDTDPAPAPAPEADAEADTEPPADTELTAATDPEAATEPEAEAFFCALRVPLPATGPFPPANTTADNTHIVAAAVTSLALRRIGSTFAPTLGDTATFLQSPK